MLDDSPPVFVDLTGRRRRRVRGTGGVAAGALVMVGALVVAALLGTSVGPSAFFPDNTPAPSPVTTENPGVARSVPEGVTTTRRSPASTTNRQAGQPGAASTT